MQQGFSTALELTLERFINTYEEKTNPILIRLIYLVYLLLKASQYGRLPHRNRETH